MAGAGTVAGIGFTVSLLIASLALNGDVLAEAKLGNPVRRGGRGAD